MLSDGASDPGFNGPLLWWPRPAPPGPTAVVHTVAVDIAAHPDVVVSPSPPSPTKPGVDVSPHDRLPDHVTPGRGTTDLINHLRSDTIPEAEGPRG